MTILPLDPEESRNPAGLRAFLERAQARAREARHAQLVSIAVEVEALDPLAVLESIFEPNERHFYVERPAEGVALAGAEAVVAFEAEGKERFARCQAFIDETLKHAIAVGAVEAPFGGPHFFAAFAFEVSGCSEPDTIWTPQTSGTGLGGTAESGPAEPGPAEPGPVKPGPARMPRPNGVRLPAAARHLAAFPAASIFVPRWQVATRAGRTVAVANILVDERTPVAPVAERVWRAHAKFRSFEYAPPPEPGLEPEGELRPRTESDGQEERRYQAAVETALADIAAGYYQKIVLARRREVAAVRALRPLRLLNGLRQRFEDCFAFSIANGKGQSFIGASPERLLEVRGGRLRTEALAGSARRGHGASEDAAMAAGLQRDEKELREHRVVLESILGELRALGLSPECAGRPGIRRFANVQHLHTPVEAKLTGGVRLLDVAGRLHPTPAVGGWPREAVRARIAELEGFSRGLYAGAIGWIDARGDGELLVGLRSALVEGGKACLYAGAGIVAGSEPARELAETELKFRAVQEALG